MADKRSFTIEINGLEKSYTDTTKLLTVLKKLPSLLGNINKLTSTLTQTLGNVNSQTQSQEKALTAQEKAEKRLETTRQRRLALDTQIGREQASETQQLRQRQQELNRTIQLENAESGSIEEKRLQLEALTQQYRSLSNEQRDSESMGGAMLTQIQTLREEYTQLEESLASVATANETTETATNSFLEGLKSLSSGINDSIDGAKDMVDLFETGITTFAMFGDQSESTQELLNDLSKVTAVLNAAQLAHNGILGKAVILEKAKSVTDLLVTKGIISQTVAQTALNIATAAFPLLAIVAGVGAAISVLNSFGDTTVDAANETENLRSKSEDFRKETELVSSALSKNMTSYRNLQTKWNDLGGDLKKQKQFIKDNKKEFDALGVEVNNVSDAETVLVKETTAVVKSLQLRAQAAAAQKIATEKYEEALRKQMEAEQLASDASEMADKKQITNWKVRLTGRSSITVDNKEKKEALANSAKLAEEAKKTMEDANNYIQKSFEATNESTKTLSDAGMQAVSQTAKKITSTAKKTGDDLAKIREAILKKQLELERKAEDDETSLIKDSYDRRAQQVKNKYNREYDDLQSQLDELNVLIQNSKDEEKAIYEKSAEAINTMINNIEEHRNTEIEAINDERNAKELSKTKGHLDILTAEYQRAYSEISKVKTVKIGGKEDGLIDVEKSKKNYEDINKQLRDYVKNLESSKTEIEKYYDDLIATYDKNSAEYEKANYDKKMALLEIDTETKKVNKEIETNTEESLNLQDQYWEGYWKKVNEKISKISEISTKIFEGLNSSIQSSIDSSKEKLEELTTAYDKAVSEREKSDTRLTTLAERAKSAEGSRSAALISQLNQEMEKNKALADQEKSLAKQKEKLEADIAKKEKKQKKMAAGQQVLQAALNTATAITSALPNIPKSIVVGALGAAQTAVAAANYAKMEKGGYIEGKRHAQGGEIREVEGGEYVINREATRQNRALLDAINSTNAVPYSFTQGETVNVREIITNNSTMIPNVELPDSDMNKKLDILNETLLNKNFNPVVSVVDINQVQNQVAVMDHLANT